MRTTIDSAGRVVLPKALRDAVGLVPGEVDVSVDGSGLRIEATGGDDLVEENGHLVIPPVGASLRDSEVKELRDAGRA